MNKPVPGTAPATLQGAPREQVAALCTRKSGGRREVLLITSRDTGRWVLPKGWPMRGKSLAQAALQEAWEEAGVRDARVRAKRVGVYHYDKRLEDGVVLPIRVQVFLARVRKMTDRFPEAHERDRRWMRPKKAAELVDEPELQALLRRL